MDSELLRSDVHTETYDTLSHKALNISVCSMIITVATSVRLLCFYYGLPCLYAALRAL